MVVKKIFNITLLLVLSSGSTKVSLLSARNRSTVKIQVMWVSRDFCKISFCGVCRMSETDDKTYRILPNEHKNLIKFIANKT